MVTGDGAFIKQINRSAILQHIIEQEYVSRAELSKITGLNKATISVQVSDLLDDNLVIESQMEHNTIGRRPIYLSINPHIGVVLGIDLDYDKIQFNISDFTGKTVQAETIPIDRTDYNTIVTILSDYISHYKDSYRDLQYGLNSVTIGVHGTVDKDEVIYFIPRYQWQNKNLKYDLENQLDIDIMIENNANLTTYAEMVYNFPKSTNLLNINLSSGIGSGIITNGKLNKGFHGFAGEIGHMVIDPQGPKCRCGNHGCWELYASEAHFYEHVKSILNDPDLANDDILKMVSQDDEKITGYIKEFISYLAIGLNNVINLYNPETVVLNSVVLQAYPQTIELLESHLQSTVTNFQHIVISSLGNEATVKGACALSIKRFFEVEALALRTVEQ